MSATNRGAVRKAADNYPTPPWCVERLLDAVKLPGGKWLEPAVGEGAIVKAVQRGDVTWTAVDVRSEAVQSVAGLVANERLYQGDFLSLTAAGTFGPKSFSVVLTNPPYTRALEFVKACLPLADIVVMLLRLPFVASKARYQFMSTHMPDVYGLSSRPSFAGGRTDATDYGWLVWTDEPRTAGSFMMLPPKS